VVVDQMVRKITLELVERVFPTSLIILEGQGIDVILGMNWMKMHKDVLDISAHMVHLDSPVFGKITLQLQPVACCDMLSVTVVATVFYSTSIV
jgi:hypothetical protein